MTSADLNTRAKAIAKLLTDAKPFSVVRHQRFGNEQAASVTGGTLKRGHIITLHPMCGIQRYIDKAIAQDVREQAQLENANAVATGQRDWL
jgi:hypothetical protein